MTQQMWCDGCRSTGAIHCAHPDQCGNMLSATAAADHWKSWLDDLPLPSTFDAAIGRLQDFITALTVRIDVPQPTPTEAEAIAAMQPHERQNFHRVMGQRAVVKRIAEKQIREGE